MKVRNYLRSFFWVTSCISMWCDVWLQNRSYQGKKEKGWARNSNSWRREVGEEGVERCTQHGCSVSKCEMNQKPESVWMSVGSEGYLWCLRVANILLPLKFLHRERRWDQCLMVVLYGKERVGSGLFYVFPWLHFRCSLRMILFLRVGRREISLSECAETWIFPLL